MATTIMINPASGDSHATIFSSTSSNSDQLSTVSKGTIMKVIGSNSGFYEVVYNNRMPDEPHGGTSIEGTIVAYPYAFMYDAKDKSNKIANVNNGTPLEIIDDTDIKIFQIKAFTTQGTLIGYIESKYIYRDIEETAPMARTLSPKAPQTGKVKATSGLKTRSGPGTSYPQVGGFENNASVTISETKSGWHKVSGSSGWGQLTNVWVSASYVVVENSNSSAGVSKTDAVVTKTDNDTTTTDGIKIANAEWEEYFATYTGANLNYTANDSYYQQLSEKYLNALGAAPRYNMDIDIQYMDEIAAGGGRVYNRTILSNPAILSLCPGKVQMFPNLIGSEKDAFFEAMLNAASGNSSLQEKINADKGAKFSGKMYQFIADTAEYAYYVNSLCRASAILLGIGDKFIPGQSTKLKDFDYTYWTIRKKYNTNAAVNSDGGDRSLFRKFWDGAVQTGSRLLSVATDDTTYINFFINGSETSVSESITTDITDSPIEPFVSTASSAGAMLNYFTGSGFDISSTDVSQALNAALGSGSTLQGILNLGENFLQGGRMVLPKMVEGAKYGRSISCNLKFMSPYGDKYSVFVKCIIPICHLLAMALPKQLSDNMYTFPFLIRGGQIGSFNIDLGVISNLNITRGGSDDTSWTQDGMATEWDVQLEITPLVDELMVTGTNHPVLFCKNESLLDYLGNFCGFDVLANQMPTKIDMMMSFITNKFLDWPNSIENKVSDTLFNKINKYFRLSW